jgi:TnpA family transposase
MPGKFLTASERQQFERFPEEISIDDIITYFTLSKSDLARLPVKSSEYNRFGFALQLGILRFLGHCPDDLASVPSLVLEYVSGQIRVSASEINSYGRRSQTRSEHLQTIQDYLGFRKASQQDLDDLLAWLTKRALEHDKPSFLLRTICERLYTEKIIRPGITILERMVISARTQAQETTYRRLEFLLSGDLKFNLDKILVPNEKLGRTPLAWLRFGATANTPSDILGAIEKLNYLRKSEVNRWDLNSINPNRRKFLAQLGRRSTNQSLQRAAGQKRYPILIAFLKENYREVIDEIIELFDRCLGDCHGRAKNDLKEHRISIAKAANEKIVMFTNIGGLVLDKGVSDDQLRSMIYQVIPEEEFREAMDECLQLIRPGDDHAYDFLGNRYSYIREFSPQFLGALNFRSNRPNDPLLKALEVLRSMNATGKRKVPAEAPTNFIRSSWLPYVKSDDGQTVRRYYEISTLWHLRNALRSGDIWVEDSRKYADPESYLIPKDQWPAMRTEACRLLGLPENGGERIIERQHELESVFSELDEKILNQDGVRIEHDDLIISPLIAEELPPSVSKLQAMITDRLPRVDLTELLIETDRWTRFSDHFTHASTRQPINTELSADLYASILAQANNHGLKKMAEISELSYPRLVWCSNWFLREETLQSAINNLVNYQFGQPLAARWGGGTMSSSDGQRFPVAVKARNTAIIPKYYGYGRILTYYSWTSDQHSQWRSKPVPSMTRDATYVLDGMIDNETELPLFEHSTDTAGYTELIFALFDLLGFMFSPRIKDLADQQIYCVDKKIHYKTLEKIIKGTVKTDSVLMHWDTILRIAASIRLGWVTASLFVSKLQSQHRQGIITKALKEYGKLIKSIYIPKYICREEQQRRVSLQLNKGEALHSLRRWLMFADEGQIRKSQLQDQANQASALTLVTNAIIVWNTRYMQAVIDQLRSEGYDVAEEDLRHISPCRFEHINKHGKLNFDVEREWSRKKLRSLRKPGNSEI